jgi:aminopeptidase N
VNLRLKRAKCLAATGFWVFARAMKTDTTPAIQLADYTPPPFLIDHVDLSFRLDGPQTKVTATYTVHPNPSAAFAGQTHSLRLDADSLGPVSVWVNGKATDALQDASSLRVTVATDTPSTLKLETVLDPAANTALSGLYLTNGVYCTQCEAQGFRRIIPFLDRPDVLATYTVAVEAQSQAFPVLLSNGNPIGAQVLGDGWHKTVWNDPHPKPSYLFALVGGQLERVEDSFTTADGREVALAIYVEPGKGERAQFAMGALKQCMAWDERRFGRLYDLEVFNIVAVSDFNLGAMENKGLNIFNDKYILASPETASDEDYERIDAIIAHEYFHNWSGNRVTCRDWFQLCLKEGLTVFRDQEYTSDLYDRAVKRIHDVRNLWAHQFPEDGGPLAHPVRPDAYREINNFYTATVYEKGAEIVRMVSVWLGETRFRAAMDRYFDTYDGQAVRLEDFLSAMKDEAGDLGDWPDFITWYTQAGTPHVEVAFEADLAEGVAKLSFKQDTKPTPGQPDKKPLPIPCRLALVDGAGDDVAIAPDQVQSSGGRWVDGQFLLEGTLGSLTLSGLPRVALRPSLFRDYSAPVNHNLSGLEEADRLFLAQNDTNAFASWAQLQALYGGALQRRYNRLKLGEPLGEDTALLEALASRGMPQGEDAHANAAARAAAITLPSAQDLARTIGQDIQPELVEDARASFVQDLCRAHGPAMLAYLDAQGFEDDGIISPQAAAQRSLVIAILTHLAGWDDQRADTIITRAHDTAKGMTMRIKTLGLLIKRRSANAQSRLDAFEERFGQDRLTMDKWFSVQARYGDAAKVHSLEGHAGYDKTNPNRVRALLGAFAAGNLVGFHAVDGAGYDLLAERIVEIDAANPQLAARLAVTFRSWRTNDKTRRKHAKLALERLIERQGLSIDLRDIVQRMVDA